ncbi:MAG: 8-amino-7-oxononanoate synthase [Casimicrobiaceae bacterium]
MAENPRTPAQLIVELERELARRATAGLVRRRRILQSPQGPRVDVDGRSILSFASNDYLGLANEPRVVAAVQAGLGAHGVGAGASALVAGHFAPHEELERALAAFVVPGGVGRVLTFSTGYLANLAILTALARRGDAIFADRLNHACLNDGALLARADFVRYPHVDVAALARALAKSAARRKIIATDAVFSMDGTIAPLPELLALAERFDALLVIDDAHGFGVLGDGRGSAAHCGIASDRLVIMGTLGKAAGVAGAFVAAHPAIVETLMQSARSYVYTTAAPPALAVGLLASLEAIIAGGTRRAHLDDLITRLRAGTRDLPWYWGDSCTAIQPLIVGDNGSAVRLADALWDRGLWVPAIRPPTVPVGTARLRVSLSAGHSLADVDRLVEALAALGALADGRAASAASAMMAGGAGP